MSVKGPSANREIRVPGLRWTHGSGSGPMRGPGSSTSLPPWTPEPNTPVQVGIAKASHTHRFPHRPESATQARTYALNFSSTSSLSAAERERRQQGSTRCVWLKLACNSSIHGHSQGHSQWRARAGRKPVGTAALNGQCTRGANTPSDHVRNGQQDKRGRQDKKKRADRPKARQANKGTYDRLRERYHERASASRMDTM